ncbi:MAG: succinyl-diaminopimelate desuccinylase [Gammaproteobacteria bacterium]
MNYYEQSLKYLKDLIAYPSITPDDAGCLEYIESVLRPLGFDCKRYDKNGVSNLWAVYSPLSTGPMLVFAGHTDVVPTGPLEKWQSPPFEASIREGVIYGRGAVDMKGGIAAMLAAVRHFINESNKNNQSNNKNKKPVGSIAFLLTSDEEGDALFGTQWVVEQLKAQNIHPDYCLIGEPSSEERLGDVVKVGRRGSLNGQLKIFGKQGHIAYPERFRNPIHELNQVLSALLEQDWEAGDYVRENSAQSSAQNSEFPPTQFQVSNLNAGLGVTNVVPGEASASFNFRFSPKYTLESLEDCVEKIILKQGLKPENYELSWKPGSKPFYSPLGPLGKTVAEAISEVMGFETKRQTNGGTSDGRFLIDLGPEILELGLLNYSNHTIDEHCSVQELYNLTEIYFKILDKLFPAI